MNKNPSYNVGDIMEVHLPSGTIRFRVVKKYGSYRPVKRQFPYYEIIKIDEKNNFISI